MSLPPSFFDHLEDRLNLAVYDTNQDYRMSVYETKQALFDVPGIEDLTIGYAGNGNQIVSLAGKTSEVGPMASNEEIRAALANPFETTEKPNIMSVSGLAPGILQAKLAELRQRGQERLAQGVAKIDAAHTTGLSKIDAAADEAAKKIDAEIDSALHEFAESTNGGPA